MSWLIRVHARLGVPTVENTELNCYGLDYSAEVSRKA